MRESRGFALYVPDRAPGDRRHRSAALEVDASERLAVALPRPSGDKTRTLTEVGALRPMRATATQFSPVGSGSFFRACILLLLREKSAHGYDLLERLTGFGFDSGDSGWLYRTLRMLERDDVVGSTWETSASGPPRRVYALTVAGRHQLHAWVVSVRASQRSVEGFLDRYSNSDASDSNVATGEVKVED